MSEESEAHLDNMAVLTLCGTILLMSVRTGHLVSDAKFMEEWVEMLILSTPVGLDCNDLLIKQALNKRLKFKEICENIKLVTQQIYPGEFTVIINKGT
jgi:hypothetical protein